MNKPLRIPFILSFVVSVAACAIAGNIVLSAAKPDPGLTLPGTHSQIDTPRDMISNGDPTLRLIDISHYDTVTDWNALKNAVDGIYLKATEGSTVTDVKLGEYAAAAINSGMPTGFYHYFWPAADPSTSVTQAQHFYDTIRGFAYKLVPVLDVEETNSQSAAVICADVKAFAAEFERLSGQKIMIYCSPNFADKYLSDPSLAAYGLWIAHYNVASPRVTTIWKAYNVWQYGTTISVAGIQNLVDADIATADVFLTGAQSVRVTPVTARPRGSTE